MTVKPSIEKLKELLEKKEFTKGQVGSDNEEREELDEADLGKWSKERTAALLNLLEEERLQTAVEAKKIADDWFTFIRTKDKDLEPCFYSIKITLKGNYLEAAWREVVFYSSANNGTSGRIVKHIPKRHGNDSYQKTVFNNFPSWAKEKAITAEEQLTRKRKRIRLISDIIKDLKRYEKILGDENYF